VDKVRSDSGPFKNYRDLIRRLRADGRLVLPRPDRCKRCGRDCGFVKDGHYFRDFVFPNTVVSHIGVQQYHCKALPKNPRFSALAAFQEPRAHFTVGVSGTVLELILLEGRSERAAAKTMRKRRGSATLSRSTVGDWRRRFHRRVPRHAAVLTAYLAQHLPSFSGPIRGDPVLFLRAARAAFGLFRSWPPECFWEWLHDLLFRASGRHLLSA
jgi:hypothetical protein